MGWQNNGQFTPVDATFMRRAHPLTVRAMDNTGLNITDMTHPGTQINLIDPSDPHALDPELGVLGVHNLLFQNVPLVLTSPSAGAAVWTKSVSLQYDILLNLSSDPNLQLNLQDAVDNGQLYNNTRHVGLRLYSPSNGSLEARLTYDYVRTDTPVAMEGLVDRPDVSQYRLTAHLGLAIAIYAYIVWLTIDLLSPERQQRSGAAISVFSIIGLVYLMILSGGFVAGTNAGLSFPTWPLMGDSFIPPALYRDGITSAFEQVTTIHFNHRMLAYATGIIIVSAAFHALVTTADRRLKIASVLMLTAVSIQIFLGISTVLSRVDVTIAAGHQSGAVVLLTAVLFWVHCRRTERAASIY